MTRDTVTLPRLPAGADDPLRLKRDIAVAVFALHKRCTLQQASDVRGQGAHV